MGGEGGADWEEEKQENCTGTLDSICTEGSLEEPRYAKVISTLTHTAVTQIILKTLITFSSQVTHKQKRGSSSTPRLARKKQEEHQIKRCS